MSFRLPESLVQELKEAASEAGISVTELVARYSRAGLNHSTEAVEERLLYLENMLEAVHTNGSAFESQTLGNAIVHTAHPWKGDTLVAPPADGAATNGKHHHADNDADLIDAFEKFIGLLEDSMSDMDEQNQLDVLNTIGDLSKLKVRLKMDPKLRLKRQSLA